MTVLSTPIVKAAEEAQLLQQHQMAADSCAGGAERFQDLRVTGLDNPA